MNENEKNPAAENAVAGNGNTNFIHEIINADIAAGKCPHVVTRFPPEPNGYLHIGHAKAICLDYGTAKKYGGTFHLRFDDTNPVKEDTEYVESIMEDVRWLGAEWGEHLYYASDYFEKFYEYACKLIRDGKAYVCELTDEEMKEYRGTLTVPGKESPWRNRSAEENLDLFERMRKGEFADGTKVLRAKIDMASPNIHMRDPIPADQGAGSRPGHQPLRCGEHRRGALRERRPQCLLRAPGGQCLHRAECRGHYFRRGAPARSVRPAS